MRPAVHPLEQLRYVARGWQIGDDFPARDVAAVLAELAEESPATLLHACRRLIEYFPASGRVWWLSARALSAPGPVEGIWEAESELARDPTGRLLAEALPASAVVSVLGPSHAVAAALRRRQDLIVEKKAPRADIVVVPAMAAGPGAVLVGSRAGTVAASAARNGREVWALVERGALLPTALWEQLLARALGPRTLTVLPADEFNTGVGEGGRAPITKVLSKPTCPPVAELLGWKS